MQRQQLETNLRLHQIAAATGELNLAEATANNVVDSMTESQLDDVISKGGIITMPDGSQIVAPMDRVMQRKQGYGQAAAVKAERIMNQIPVTAAAKIATDTVTQIRGLNDRAGTILGSESFYKGSASALSEVGQLSQQLTEAIQTKQPPEVIKAITLKLNQVRQTYTDSVDQSILNHTGGDKIAAGLLKGFIYNQPIDSAAAAKGIAHYAVSGQMPKNIGASPAVKQIFTRLTARAQQLRGEKGMTPAKLEATLTAEAQTLAQEVVGTDRFNDLEKTLPIMAKRAGHDFGKINQQAWDRVRIESEQAGYEAVARELGTTPEVVRAMQATNKAVGSSEADLTLFKKFNSPAVRNIFAAQSQAALVEGLDELPNARPGERNSDVLIDFMNSGAMMQRIGDDAAIRGHMSMGDYLLNPIVPGATEQVTRKYINDLTAAQSVRDSTVRQEAREQQRAYGNNFQARIFTIIAAIPGVGASGRDKLAPFIRQQLSDGENALAMGVSQGMQLPGGINPTGAMYKRALEARVFEALSSTKFQDPATEAYRKQAVKGWKETTETSDSFMGFLKDAMGM